MSLDVSQRKRAKAQRQYKGTTKEKSKSPPLSENNPWDAKGMDEDSCSSSSGDGVYDKDLMGGVPANVNAVEDGAQKGVKGLRKTEDGTAPETNTNSSNAPAPAQRPVMERQRSRSGASLSSRGEQRAGIKQASESPRQPAASAYSGSCTTAGAEGVVDASEHNSDDSSDMGEELPTEEEVLARIEELTTRKHTLFQQWKTKNAEKRRADATMAKTRNDVEESVDTRQDATSNTFSAPANQTSAIPTTPTPYANSADGSHDAYATAAVPNPITATTNQAVPMSQSHPALRTYPMSFASGNMGPDDATSETPKPLAAGPFHQQLSAFGKRLEAPSPPHSGLPAKRVRGGRRHEDPFTYYSRDLSGAGAPRLVGGVPPMVPNSALSMTRRSSAVPQPSVPIPPTVSRPSVLRPPQAPPDRPRGRY